MKEITLQLHPVSEHPDTWRPILVLNPGGSCVGYYSYSSYRHLESGREILTPEWWAEMPGPVEE